MYSSFGQDKVANRWNDGRIERGANILHIAAWSINSSMYIGHAASAGYAA